MTRQSTHPTGIPLHDPQRLKAKAQQKLLGNVGADLDPTSFTNAYTTVSEKGIGICPFVLAHDIYLIKASALACMVEVAFAAKTSSNTSPKSVCGSFAS